MFVIKHLLTSWKHKFARNLCGLLQK